MKRVATVLVLLGLLGISACGHDGTDPATSPRTPDAAKQGPAAEGPSSEDVRALQEKGEDQFVEDETVAANEALYECLTVAGDDAARRAACQAAFKARLKQVIDVVGGAKATSSDQAPR